MVHRQRLFLQSGWLSGGVDMICAVALIAPVLLCSVTAIEFKTASTIIHNPKLINLNGIIVRNSNLDIERFN